MAAAEAPSEPGWTIFDGSHHFVGTCAVDARWALKMEVAMWRVSFLAALFSVAGINSVVASQSLPATWLGDAVWLVIAGSSALAVMAFEAETD